MHARRPVRQEVGDLAAGMVDAERAEYVLVGADWFATCCLSGGRVEAVHGEVGEMGRTLSVRVFGKVVTGYPSDWTDYRVGDWVVATPLSTGEECRDCGRTRRCQVSPGAEWLVLPIHFPAKDVSQAGGLYAWTFDPSGMAELLGSCIEIGQVVAVDEEADTADVDLPQLGGGVATVEGIPVTFRCEWATDYVRGSQVFRPDDFVKILRVGSTRRVIGFDDGTCPNCRIPFSVRITDHEGNVQDGIHSHPVRVRLIYQNAQGAKLVYASSEAGELTYDPDLEAWVLEDSLDEALPEEGVWLHVDVWNYVQNSPGGMRWETCETQNRVAHPDQGFRGFGLQGSLGDPDYRLGSAYYNPAGTWTPESVEGTNRVDLLWSTAHRVHSKAHREAQRKAGHYEEPCYAMQLGYLTWQMSPATAGTAPCSLSGQGLVCTVRMEVQGTSRYTVYTNPAYGTVQDDPTGASGIYGYISGTVYAKRKGEPYHACYGHMWGWQNCWGYGCRDIYCIPTPWACQRPDGPWGELWPINPSWIPEEISLRTEGGLPSILARHEVSPGIANAAVHDDPKTFEIRSHILLSNPVGFQKIVYGPTACFGGSITTTIATKFHMYLQDGYIQSKYYSAGDVRVRH
jgi:hypothetical protein